MNRKSFPFVNQLDNQLKLYHNDWLTMFIQKPRIQWHGVYISRINYQRQGYGENFNQPIHLVFSALKMIHILDYILQVLSILSE